MSVHTVDWFIVVPWCLCCWQTQSTVCFFFLLWFITGHKSDGLGPVTWCPQLMTWSFNQILQLNLNVSSLTWTSKKLEILYYSLIFWPKWLDPDRILRKGGLSCHPFWKPLLQTMTFFIIWSLSWESCWWDLSQVAFHTCSVITNTVIFTVHICSKT